MRYVYVMAQKLRKTVPQTEQQAPSPTQSSHVREFLRALPQLGFLLPIQRRHSRRFQAVKQLLGKLLGSLVPALAASDPQTLDELLYQ